MSIVKISKPGHFDVKTSMSLLKKVLPLLKSEFTDSKGEYQVLLSQRSLNSSRSLARGMFNGDKIYHMYMGTAGTLSTTGTTGTLAAAVNFTTDIQNCGNWSSLASIFDEFTFVKVKLNLCPSSPAFNVSSPAPTILAIDDDGFTAAGSLSYSVVAQYPTAKWINPAIQGSTLGTEANSTSMHPYVVEHSRPYPNNMGPVVNAPSTGWVDVATPNNLLGSWITFNSTLNSSNNVAVYLYLAQYEVAFRFVR